MYESINEDEVKPTAEIVGKYEKAHERAITGIWTFRFGGQIGMITVAHDSSKLWVLNTQRSGKGATIEERMVLASWRHAVQAAEVSMDGQYAIIIGMDSTVHEIEMVNEVKYTKHDFGYLEAVHCALSPNKTGYVTAAFSGTLNDIQKCSDTLVKKEPFPGVKGISCLKYSRDGKYVAIGQLDGGVEVFEAETFKSFHKYEVHSMRVRRIEFLPGNDRFLTACDDRLIKLNSLSDFSLEADPSRSTKAIRVYSAHDSPVTGLTIDERSGGTRFASSSTSAQIFIWHIELATPIISVKNEHIATVSALSFAPTGQHLLSGGDDGMVQIYCIPDSGQESPEYSGFYQQTQDELVEQSEVENEKQSPRYHAEEELPSEDNLVQQEQQEYYARREETNGGTYQQEPESSNQYQEYNPYAEPRTPPQEEDDDIGDYVYNASTENATYQAATSPSHEERDPEAYKD